MLPKVDMTRRSVRNFLLSVVALTLFSFALHNVFGGQVWAYIVLHPWQTIFLPLVVIFLVLLASGLYRQYRQEP
jgi:hypothetical protein